MSLKLEVGEFYLSASGEIVNINGKNEDMFLDTNSNGYFLNGHVRPKDKISIFDLIAHIPKQLHYELLLVIDDYYNNKDYKRAVDEKSNNLGKNINE